MAKGKPTSKIAKGANGRKNHGPKRHLQHDIFPKSLRMEIGKSGLFSKYDSFDSFCVAMQARNVRADYHLMWAEFRSIKTTDASGEPLPGAKVAMKEFFDNAAQIGVNVMKKAKAPKK